MSSKAKHFKTAGKPSHQRRMLLLGIFVLTQKGMRKMAGVLTWV